MTSVAGRPSVLRHQHVEHRDDLWLFAPRPRSFLRGALVALCTIGLVVALGAAYRGLLAWLS